MEVNTKILSDATVHMKYSRFLPEMERRETWEELVARNESMHIRKFPKLYKEIKEAYKLVYERKVLPSMRSLQFAGKPIDLNPARIFNCSFMPMDHPAAFSELMFLLLSGVGVGYSVQHAHIEKLPHVFHNKKTRRFVVDDSIVGWADAVKVLVRSYFENKPRPIFDFSDIRPKGARLITSGGKAPGPEPLKDALHNIAKIFDRKDDGESLTSLDIHDINCYIADAVLAGGIRRSAMIALFDLDDDEMLTCKSNLSVDVVGDVEIDPTTKTAKLYVNYRKERLPVLLDEYSYNEYASTGKLAWYYLAPQRGRANNSAVILRHKIDKETFLDLWKRIEASQSGEPGFFMTNDVSWGLNPCAEISLKSNQFCNLTTINASNIESQDDLNARAKSAAFIGTLQASYTDFHYLRDIWKRTTEKEALIGVSMTGVASGNVLSLDMKEAATIVKDTNAYVADLIGINKAARTTTLKPEGTTSLVVGSSSGIHAWHNDYYIRRVRVGKTEAIYQYLAENHPELVEDEYFKPNQQAVISVPIKAPEGAILRNESALDLLARVKHVWTDWIKTGHRKGANVNNVSATVSIKPDEWPEVGEWMWENRDSYTALSVLPANDHTYIQAPFEDITKERYEELSATLRDIDLTKVIESKDETTLSDNLACQSGACEIV